MLPEPADPAAPSAAPRAHLELFRRRSYSGPEELLWVPSDDRQGAQELHGGRAPSRGRRRPGRGDAPRAPVAIIVPIDSPRPKTMCGTTRPPGRASMQPSPPRSRRFPRGKPPSSGRGGDRDVRRLQCVRIDLRYPRDPNAPANRQFLDALRARGSGVTGAINVLEVCGVLFVQLERPGPPGPVHHFERRYGVTVLPRKRELLPWCRARARGPCDVCRRFALGDALVA